MTGESLSGRVLDLKSDEGSLVRDTNEVLCCVLEAKHVILGFVLNQPGKCSYGNN